MILIMGISNGLIKPILISRSEMENIFIQLKCNKHLIKLKKSGSCIFNSRIICEVLHTLYYYMYYVVSKNDEVIYLRPPIILVNINTLDEWVIICFSFYYSVCESSCQAKQSKAKQSKAKLRLIIMKLKNILKLKV